MHGDRTVFCEDTYFSAFDMNVVGWDPGIPVGSRGSGSKKKKLFFTKITLLFFFDLPGDRSPETFPEAGKNAL